MYPMLKNLLVFIDLSVVFIGVGSLMKSFSTVFHPMVSYHNLGVTKTHTYEIFNLYLFANIQQDKSWASRLYVKNFRVLRSLSNFSAFLRSKNQVERDFALLTLCFLDEKKKQTLKKGFSFLKTILLVFAFFLVQLTVPTSVNARNYDFSLLVDYFKSSTFLELLGTQTLITASAMMSSQLMPFYFITGAVLILSAVLTWLCWLLLSQIKSIDSLTEVIKNVMLAKPSLNGDTSNAIILKLLDSQKQMTNHYLEDQKATISGLKLEIEILKEKMQNSEKGPSNDEMFRQLNTLGISLAETQTQIKELGVGVAKAQDNLSLAGFEAVLNQTEKKLQKALLDTKVQLSSEYSQLQLNIQSQSDYLKTLNAGVSGQKLVNAKQPNIIDLADEKESWSLTEGYNWYGAYHFDTVLNPNSFVLEDKSVQLYNAELKQCLGDLTAAELASVNKFRILDCQGDEIKVMPSKWSEVIEGLVPMSHKVNTLIKNDLGVKTASNVEGFINFQKINESSIKLYLNALTTAENRIFPFEIYTRKVIICCLYFIMVKAYTSSVSKKAYYQNNLLLLLDFFYNSDLNFTAFNIIRGCIKNSPKTGLTIHQFRTHFLKYQTQNQSWLTVNYQITRYTVSETAKYYDRKKLVSIANFLFQLFHETTWNQLKSDSTFRIVYRSFIGLIVDLTRDKGSYFYMNLLMQPEFFTITTTGIVFVSSNVDAELLPFIKNLEALLNNKLAHNFNFLNTKIESAELPKKKIRASKRQVKTTAISLKKYTNSNFGACSASTSYLLRNKVSLSTWKSYNKYPTIAYAFSEQAFHSENSPIRYAALPNAPSISLTFNLAGKIIFERKDYSHLLAKARFLFINLKKHPQYNKKTQTFEFKDQQPISIPALLFNFDNLSTNPGQEVKLNFEVQEISLTFRESDFLKQKTTTVTPAYTTEIFTDSKTPLATFFINQDLTPNSALALEVLLANENQYAIDFKQLGNFGPVVLVELTNYPFTILPAVFAIYNDPDSGPSQMLNTINKILTKFLTHPEIIKMIMNHSFFEKTEFQKQYIQTMQDGCKKAVEGKLSPAFTDWYTTSPQMNCDLSAKHITYYQTQILLFLNNKSNFTEIKLEKAHLFVRNMRMLLLNSVEIADIDGQNLDANAVSTPKDINANPGIDNPYPFKEVFDAQKTLLQSNNPNVTFREFLNDFIITWIFANFVNVVSQNQNKYIQSLSTPDHLKLPYASISKQSLLTLARIVLELQKLEISRLLLPGEVDFNTCLQSDISNQLATQSYLTHKTSTHVYTLTIYYTHILSQMNFIKSYASYLSKRYKDNLDYKDQHSSVIAVSDMGGILKTILALEYQINIIDKKNIKLNKQLQNLAEFMDHFWYLIWFVTTLCDRFYNQKVYSHEGGFLEIVKTAYAHDSLASQIGQPNLIKSSGKVNDAFINIIGSVTEDISQSLTSVKDSCLGELKFLLLLDERAVLHQEQFPEKKSNLDDIRGQLAELYILVEGNIAGVGALINGLSRITYYQEIKTKYTTTTSSASTNSSPISALNLSTTTQSPSLKTQPASAPASDGTKSATQLANQAIAIASKSQTYQFTKSTALESILSNTKSTVKIFREQYDKIIFKKEQFEKWLPSKFLLKATLKMILTYLNETKLVSVIQLEEHLNTKTVKVKTDLEDSKNAYAKKLIEGLKNLTLSGSKTVKSPDSTPVLIGESDNEFPNYLKANSTNIGICKDSFSIGLIFDNAGRIGDIYSDFGSDQNQCQSRYKKVLIKSGLSETVDLARKEKIVAIKKGVIETTGDHFPVLLVLKRQHEYKKPKMFKAARERWIALLPLVGSPIKEESQGVMQSNNLPTPSLAEKTQSKNTANSQEVVTTDSLSQTVIQETIAEAKGLSPITKPHLKKLRKTKKKAAPSD